MVWLTALPLVLSRFHVITPVTLLISPAIWIVVLVALWSGFLMLLVGGIAPPLAAIFGAVCDGSLGALENIVEWAEKLPAGHFWSPGPTAWWLAGFYVTLVAAMLSGRRVVAYRWQVAAISRGFSPAACRLSISRSRDELRCSFVAVGHGTCVLLEGPKGETLLYDAGSLGSPELATRTVSSYLWERGKFHIDAVVLSHADTDHYNALPGLLERFRVGTVYMSPVMFKECGFREEGSVAKVPGSASSSLNSEPQPVNPLTGPAVLRAAIDRAGVPVRQIWAGDRLRLGREVSIEVLHPPRLGVVGNDNANSVTLYVEHAGRRVLLPGDLESPGMEDLTAERPHDCDVLLAPHHGSRRSDPPGFAAWSTPEWVVVSNGNVDVSPSIRSYEQAGAIVLETHRQGTVEIAISSGPIRVATWRAPAGRAVYAAAGDSAPP